jgi:plasmid replication DNA-binding protein KfrA
MSMSESILKDENGPAYTGQDVIYRERGVSALDVQRAADALLRLGQKPSIAALREQLGGGSPNTLGPLLEKYWKSLGHRIPAGPDALERVPESLARLTEALWLRAINEARERVGASTLSKTPQQQAFEALENTVSELTAALAESRARESQTEAQLVTSLRDRVHLREQVSQLTAMLGAEQELRAQDRGKTDAQGRELQERRGEIRDLARRRLATRLRRKAVFAQAKTTKKKVVKKPKKKALAASIGKRRKRGRTRLVRQGHR